MNVDILQENFQRALRRVRGPIGKAATPRQMLMLIETDGPLLRLRTANLSFQVSEWVGASIRTGGATCLPYDALARIVPHLGPTTITLAGGTLRTPAATLALPNRDAADFAASIAIPAGQAPLRSAVFESGRVLGAALKVLSDHTSYDDSRPALKGVLAEIGADSVVFVSSDGFRVALRCLPATVSSEAVGSKILLPGDALRALIPLLDKEPVEMLVGDAVVVFRTGSTEVAAYSAQGAFPQYRQLFPEAFAYSATVNAGELLRQAVVMAAVIAAGDAIRFCFDDRSVAVSAASGEGKVSVKVPAVVTGEPGRIAFSPGFVLDALKGVSGDIAFRANSPSMQALWERPDGASILTMPMYVQW